NHSFDANGCELTRPAHIRVGNIAGCWGPLSPNAIPLLNGSSVALAVVQEITSEVSEFGAVCCLKLPHQVAYMYLDRALAHIEFIGDNLVGLALAHCLQNSGLASSENPISRRFAAPRTFVLEASTQYIGGSIGAASSHQTDCFDGEAK